MWLVTLEKFDSLSFLHHYWEEPEALYCGPKQNRYIYDDRQSIKGESRATYILSKRFSSSGATDGLVAFSALRILAIEICTCGLFISTTYHGANLSVPCVAADRPFSSLVWVEYLA